MRATATCNTYNNPYLDHAVQAHLSKQIWTTELRAGTRTGTNEGWRWGRARLEENLNRTLSPPPCTEEYKNLKWATVFISRLHKYASVLTFKTNCNVSTVYWIIILIS